MEWSHYFCSRADVISTAGYAFGMSQVQTFFSQSFTWYKSTTTAAFQIQQHEQSKMKLYLRVFWGKNTDIPKLVSVQPTHIMSSVRKKRGRKCENNPAGSLLLIGNN